MKYEEPSVFVKSKRSSSCGCSECGGLDTMCRPRFFAGQLLTEEEFKRLDRYIVQKNKLHNRYLHGWGVVGGLDVVCNDCGDGVVVKEGYALSPCGGDIIVSKDTVVDVCSLIEACVKKTQSNCEDSYFAEGCEDTEQQWVLAICYSETPSRGITPLRNGPKGSGDCGCTDAANKYLSKDDCGCGGSSHKPIAKATKQGDCGCGGESGSTHTGSTSDKYFSKPRGDTYNRQCEPSVLCEGYTFKMYRAPLRKKESGRGAMVDRMMACMQDLADISPPIPTNKSNQAMHDWCCAAKDALLEYLATHQGYDCELRRSASQIVCPPVSLPNESFAAALEVATQQIVGVAGEIFFSCICRALQPPVLSAVAGDCVPLAVININRRDGCKVSSICNWTTLRRYAITIPNLEYWMSMLPFGRMFREAIERFCCSGGGLRGMRQTTPEKGGETVIDDTTIHASPSQSYQKYEYKESDTLKAQAAPEKENFSEMSPSSMFRASPQTMAYVRTLGTLVSEAVSGHNTSLNAQSLVLGMLGEKNLKGEPSISSVQKENLPQFLMLDQMVKPLVRSFTSNFGSKESIDLASVMARAMSKTADESTAVKEEVRQPSSDSQAIRGELVELRATIQRQQATIDRLTEVLSTDTTSPYADTTVRKSASSKGEAVKKAKAATKRRSGPSKPS